MATLDGINSIEDMDLENRTVFLRLDLNVPLKDKQITDETRITAALPTIKYAKEKGAKLVIASHLGRPKTDEDKEKLSMDVVASRLGELLNLEVILVEEPASEAPKALLAGLRPNQIIMLENLRFEKGETKNEGPLAESVAKYCDIYINDAFGASHRAHSSVVGIPGVIKNKGLGFLMKKELEILDRMLEGGEKPFFAVLGGAKVSDKIGVIEKLVDKVDGFIIGGAMAYTFLAAEGLNTGKSLVEKDKVHFAKELIKRLETRGKKLLLPVDHKCVKSFGETEVTTVENIPDDQMAVDIGPKTMALYNSELAKAKTVFWNGPMGAFETQAYSEGTFTVAECLASLEDSLTVVGGGDSAAAAKASGLSEKFSHISTGGGASLEYLQGIELPGIQAMRQS